MRPRPPPQACDQSCPSAGLSGSGAGATDSEASGGVAVCSAVGIGLAVGLGVLCGARGLTCLPGLGGEHVEVSRLVARDAHDADRALPQRGGAGVELVLVEGDHALEHIGEREQIRQVSPGVVGQVRQIRQQGEDRGEGPLHSGQIHPGQDRAGHPGTQDQQVRELLSRQADRAGGVAHQPRRGGSRSVQAHGAVGALVAAFEFVVESWSMLVSITSG